MLEEQDLQKIGKLVKDSEERIVDNVIVQVGELLETNLLPEIHEIRNTLKTLPDKDFVAKLVGGVDGKSVARDKTLMEKTNTITDTLERKTIFTPAEITAIRQVQFAPENQ